MFSFLSGKYLGADLLNLTTRITLCHLVKKCQAVFPSGCARCAFPPAHVRPHRQLLLTNTRQHLPSGCEVVNRVPLSFSILHFKDSVRSVNACKNTGFHVCFSLYRYNKNISSSVSSTSKANTTINVLIICYVLARIVFKKYLLKEPMKASPWMLLTLDIFSCGHRPALLLLGIVLPLRWCFSTVRHFLTGLSELFM